jgi:hypothetical protein
MLKKVDLASSRQCVVRIRAATDAKTARTSAQFSFLRNHSEWLQTLPNTSTTLRGFVMSLLDEDIVSLSEGRQIMPGSPCMSTMWRWCLRGVRGHVLESMVVGATRFTSRQAIARFIDAQNEPKCPPSLPVEPERTSKQRARRIERAEHRLREAGI